MLDEVQRCPELLSWLQGIVDEHRRMGEFVLTGSARAPDSLNEWLLTGGYPSLHDRPLAPGDWFANCAATYVERDVRQLIEVRDLGQFLHFIRLCAARSGQLLKSGTKRTC